MPDTTDISDLYRRYASLVHRRARAILGCDDDASDVVHEVFVKAMSQSAFDDGPPITWLYRVTTNHCIDLMRVRGRRRAIVSDHEQELFDEVATRDDDERLTVTRLLRELDDELRMVAFHFYVDEMSQDEIAAHVGVSRRTVGYRLQHFRGQARALRERVLAEVA